MKQNDIKINKSKIPKFVTCVTETLEKAGFEVFLVGGCVRDLVMSQILSGTEGNREPKDWDLTTNAKPEEIIGLFEKTIYENSFGTVGVCIPIESVPHETNGETKYHIIEVTPYRIEAKYSDFRHPEEVIFSDNIDDDLKRRDFTINALAYNSKGLIKDNFDGLKDIKDKMIRAVGDPNERFQEDALRMLRAIRFSTELNFTVSYETMEAIANNSELIKKISFERIRDEFNKIIMSDNPVAGIGLMQKLGLLKYIIPELEEGIGCEQKGEHIYDVYEHLMHALDHSAKKKWPLEIRLSALFHDIGKPRSRRDIHAVKTKLDDFEWSGTASVPLVPASPAGRRGPDKLFPKSTSKKQYTFYGHEVIGERIVKQIMERLKYSKMVSDKVISFTRNHMFFSDPDKITLSAVRRVVQHVGKDNIWDLMKVRECDRVGMKKVEAPYRLRKYHAMIEEVLRDPISVGQLAINGSYLIEELHMKPSPRMGWILNALLEEVLDDPTKNNKEHLTDLVKSLDMLGDEELRTLGERGKGKKEELENEEIKKLRAKHGV